MVKIGELNTLSVVDLNFLGASLDGGADGDIFLPRADFPQGIEMELGLQLEVFLYVNSEDQLVATSKMPIALVNEFAILRVVSLERVGAFLDWGLPKDLLLPFAEQTRELRAGDDVVVFIYVDKSGRLSASMRLQRHVEAHTSELKIGDPVGLVIVARTDLGFKALVNSRYFGMLFGDEVFQTLRYADAVTGYVKFVRPDGKLDLTLARIGYKAASDDIGPMIMEQLAAKGGFLAVNDKSSAEQIHKLFGVSRKKFKIALGGLYKQRSIAIEKDGIRLV